MAFTEPEREYIRIFMGFDRLYISSNPYLDQAINTIQSLADGGSAPDSSIENMVRVALNNTIAIDGYVQSILNNPNQLAVSTIPTALGVRSELNVNFDRAISSLRKAGTNSIQKIAIALGLQPIRPYFYSDGLQPDYRAFRPRPFPRQR